MKPREQVRAWLATAEESLSVARLRAALEARRDGDRTKIEAMLRIADGIEADLRSIVAGFSGRLQFALGLGEVEQEDEDSGGDLPVAEAMRALPSTETFSATAFQSSTAFLDEIGGDLLGEGDEDTAICWAMIAAYGFLRRIRTLLNHDEIWT